MAAQECDCDFSTSGDTVIEPDILNFYEKTHIQEPVERRGMDGNLWVWQIPDYSRDYMVVADVARGDGNDYSAFHVFDIEEATQVAEYKAQVQTKDYGNLLFAIATEYNDALLVVENANIGWAVIQQLIDRGYRNLYYSPKMDVSMTNADQYLSRYENGQGMVPGFTTSMKTRPLVVSKLVSYLHEKSVIFRSKRLLEEFRTFIWKNGKAQALSGYNDDLTMAFGISMFLRDTALHFRQQGVDMARASLGGIHSTNYKAPNIYQGGNQYKNPYEMENPYGDKEDISWLLG